MINKLGTVMNTIGSLGVGWYAAILARTQAPFPTNFTDTFENNWWGLLAFGALLAAGLIIRIKDIRAKARALKDEEQTNALMEQDLHDYEDRLYDAQHLIEGAVAKVVRDTLPEIVAEEVKKQLHDPTDAARGAEVPVSGAE